MYLVTLVGTTVTERKQVYLTDKGFTTNSEEEGAEPVGLYAATVTPNDVNTTAATEATEGTFVLAQGTTTDFADVKYVTEEIASAEAGAPGAEYGTIPGVVFLIDGTLEIVDNVTTAEVPVYI